MNPWVETSFGEWLRRRRKAAGLTQEQLAREIGCSTSALKKIEAEQRRPSAQLVERIAARFKIPPTDQFVFLRFARGDAGAEPAETEQAAPWRAAPPPTRSNLSAPTTWFIGRAQAILEVRAYLMRPETRLVTLVGAPGIGKTRLSIECARSVLNNFPDGVFFVTLAALVDPALIDATIAHALGYAGARGIPLDERLKRGIGVKELLLVLDNCEHLLDACARLADALLRACPNLHILATSQEALRIEGETSWTVPPLALPERAQPLPTLGDLAQVEAVRLFVERARAVKPDFALTEQNAMAIAQICRRLDGMPLAIELAAARVKMLTVEHLAARLDDHLDLLITGNRAALPRHQTLRATIGWSYELLPAEARLLFRRLAVFAGGFTLNAAEAVCAAEPLSARAVLDLLARLVDRSLVTVSQNEPEERYHMLQTIHEYARAKLSGEMNEPDETAPTKMRQLEFFLALAEQAELKLVSAERRDWLARLDAELDNLRAALEWSLNPAVESELGLRLASALGEFWFYQGFMREGRAWLERTLARVVSERATPSYRKTVSEPKGMYALGRLTHKLGDSDTALALLESSQQLWSEFSPLDKRGLARTLVELGEVVRKQGQIQSGRDLSERAVTLFREQGDRAGLAEALILLGMSLRDQEDFTRARRVAREGASIYDALGDELGVAESLHVLGLIAYREGDYAAGILDFEQALAISRRLGERVQISYRLHDLAILWLCQGDTARANEFNRAGEILFRELGNRDGIVHSLYKYGQLAMFRDDTVSAEGYYRETIELVREGIGVGWLRAGCLFGFAMVAAVRGQPERAGRLWGAAEKHIMLVSSFWDAADDRLYARTIARAEKRLGPRSFTQAYAEGYAMEWGPACDYALERTDMREEGALER